MNAIVRALKATYNFFVGDSILLAGVALAFVLGLLTLLVIPTFYEILFDFREKLLGKARERPVVHPHFDPAAAHPLAQEHVP